MPELRINTSDFALDLPTIVNFEVTIISDVDPFETATFTFVVKILSTNCVKALQVPPAYSEDFIYLMFTTGAEANSFLNVREFG